MTKEDWTRRAATLLAPLLEQARRLSTGASAASDGAPRGGFAELNPRQMAQIFQTAGVPLAVADALTGSFIAVNSAFGRLYDTTPSALEGRPVATVYPPGEAARLPEIIGLANALGHTRVETTHQRRSGQAFPALLDLTVLYDDAGAPRYRVVTVEDLTERETRNQALAERTSELARAQAVAGMGSYVRDLQTLEIRFSPNLRRLADLLEGPAELQRYVARIHPGDRERVQQAWEDALQHHGPFQAEYRLQLRSGAVRHVLDQAEITTDAADRPLEWFGTLLDITALKETEAALRESEERYRALSEATFEGLGITSHGQVVATNRQMETILGYGPGELEGLPVLELVHPEDRDRVLAHIRTGSSAPYEHRSLRRDGSVVHLEVRGAPATYRGEPVRLTALRDVTERHRHEEERRSLHEQLLQSQKLEAVGRLAGGIAHDFNNLLMGIAVQAELLQEAVPPDNPVAAEAEEIRTAVDRGASLVKQLLAFSRQQDRMPQAVNPNAAIRRAERLLRRLLGEDVTLELALTPEAWPVLVDPVQLEQVLLNLALNARDAMPTGGHLCIATENRPGSGGEAHEADPPEMLCIEIRDTGVGMDENTQAHLFEPFFTTKEVGQGSGLGLATVYGIVTGHGGAVEVTSRPGAGSAFRVLLPRTTEVPAGPEPPPVESRPPGRGLILLVEDEPIIRRPMQRVLERDGYDVIVAGSPTEALTAMAECPTPIDLLITDVVMPGMDGPSLAAILREQRPDLPVLFMSGYADAHLRSRGELDGPEEFLQKPFRMAELGARVAALLQR